MTDLMLNMIVKNEGARIERCLTSVLPFVKSAVFLDTGSTDDTQSKISALCHKYKVPFRMEAGPFINFSQARNAAFQFARVVNDRLRYNCEFALLMDADMELRVKDTDAFNNLNCFAASYDMWQHAGGMMYANRRLVSLSVEKKPYVGVTHEYIDLPAEGMITGAHFIDHADGANRENKFVRDCQLLEQGIKDEPDNARYYFYLGNSYRDWGATDKTVLPYAVTAYTKRIEMGGWDEEVWNATINLAEVYKEMGQHAHFEKQMIIAHEKRPQRAESLYALAKHHREKGENNAALLFASAGVNIKQPSDVLFVNTFVYSHGLRYEYSIAGYYNEAHRSRAFQTTDDLVLDPTCPKEFRDSARNNLFWFTKPLKEYCPSVDYGVIPFQAPEGYVAMNPSVVVDHNVIRYNIRCVNYRINEHGQYTIGGVPCGADAVIDTRNFLVSIDDSGAESSATAEIIWNRGPPAWDRVTGLEDIRLFWHRGELRFSATIREQLASGMPQMVTGQIMSPKNGIAPVKTWGTISDGSKCEKNWMPVPSIGDPRWMYNLSTLLTPDGHRGHAVINSGTHAVDDIRGGSQLIEFKAGYLCVVHEAVAGYQGKRSYMHRFVWFNHDFKLFRISLPFVFEARQIEFCAGLALHPNGKDLIISYGVRDEEAHFAVVNVEEVSTMIWKTHES